MPIDYTLIFDAVLAPLYDPVGVQGLAYGLLGLKTIRKVIDFGRDYVNGDETVDVGEE